MGEESSAEAWDRLASEFVEGYFAAHPTFAASCGRHEYDGRLPDWSPGGLAAEVRRLADLRQRAIAVDGGQLDAGRRLAREVLLTQADTDLFWLDEAAWPALNPLFYSAALDPSLYVSREYAPAAQRAAAFMRFTDEVPLAVAQMLGNFRQAGRRLPDTFLDLGIASFSGLAGFCRDEVPAVFAGQVGDEALLGGVRAGGEAAAAAFETAARWCADERRRAGDGDEGEYRLGAERFSRMLRATERIDLPLDVIAAAGRRDLQRNLDALTAACARYAPGESVATCMARVQASKPAEGPVAAARRQLGRLRGFLEEKQLVTVPRGGDGGEGRSGGETSEAQVEEAPPHQRWNSAYIEIPGPYDRHLPSIYYIAPPDPAWSAAEREAYLPGEADLLFVSAHEVWPGHFLQFLHSNRAPSEICRLFVGYGFAEGWAHYGEEMLWEAGFADGDAETHIGQLQNALLRNVRLLVAIGLHRGEMTIAEAETMFREQAFQDQASARQQAARATFDPAYLNYTLGKLVIRKLREDWLAAAPGRDWRGFHDGLLSYGGPPLPVVRSAMMNGDGGSLL